MRTGRLWFEIEDVGFWESFWGLVLEWRDLRSGLSGKILRVERIKEKKAANGIDTSFGVTKQVGDGVKGYGVLSYTTLCLQKRKLTQ